MASSLKLGLMLAVASASVPASAAVVLTNPVYTQDFNTLARTGTSSILPAGWAIAETGSSANATYAAGTGSSNVGNTYSFGLANNPERALGAVASISLIPTYGAEFTNALGGTITTLDLSYFGELWRVGSSGVTNTLRFSYSTNATSLLNGTYTNFTPLNYVVAPVGAAGLRNGNLNRTAIAGSITGLTIANGSSFWLRWQGANEFNDDHGMGIDDFGLSATVSVVPEPSTWAMLIAGFGLVGVAARRRRAALAA